MKPIRITARVALVGQILLVLFGILFSYFREENYLTLAVLIINAFLVILLSIFYNRLQSSEKISEIGFKVEDSIKSQDFKNRLSEMNQDAFAKLNQSISYLIREQNSEIETLKQVEIYRREFLGDVAHELRSPVFNLQGYLHTLKEGAWNDREVSEKFLIKACNHIDHLSSLLEDLMTISRIESGQLKLEKSSFSPKNLVEEVCMLLDLSAKEKNITLNLIDLSEGKEVFADRERIKQVVLNIINNSIKYGTDGGNTSVTLKLEGSRILFEISDNGKGIENVHLPRIFERFYRVDKSRNREGQSTGLGLSIVKHIIEAHGENIYVTSRIDVGSIFSFSLPQISV